MAKLETFIVNTHIQIFGIKSLIICYGFKCRECRYLSIHGMYSCITPTVTCNEEPSWKITPFKNFNSKSLHRFENMLTHAWSGFFLKLHFTLEFSSDPAKKTYSIDWLAKQISINSYLCVRHRKCLCISWSTDSNSNENLCGTYSKLTR